MAGKSRRSRGRHIPRSKRKKGKGISTPRTQPAVVAPQGEPPPRADTLAPSAKAPTPKAAVAEHLSVNVAAELRRIGIVAGIILVILVVLAVIFS